MGLLDRLRRRRKTTPPTRVVRAPTWQGEARESPLADPEHTERIAVDDVVAHLAAQPTPRLELHWASWDEGSMALLPQLLARPDVRGLSLVSLGWDAFLDAPTGRIPGMAQRPARWRDGSELAAYHRELELPGRTLMLEGRPEALVEALGLDDALLPVVVLVDETGARAFTHHGPPGGSSWKELLTRIADLSASSDS